MRSNSNPSSYSLRASVCQPWYKPGLASAALLLVLAVVALPVLAQSPPSADVRAIDIERRQAQEIEAQRARASQRPDVHAGPSPGGLVPMQFPDEQPCFVIGQVYWDGPAPPGSLDAAGRSALGQCVGAGGVRMLQQHLQGLLADAGLITSRVLVPEQSLAAGVLTLRYVPGRLSGVKSEGGVGWWRTAVPTGLGGMINQRDLDQALENIRRLAGQADASIDVAPGPDLGDSDLLIRPGTGKRWHAYVGADNAGLDTIGRYQLSAGLTLDSPLFLYDQLSVAWNSNAHWRDRLDHTRAASVNYNVPFGYWSLFASASQSTYRQTVAGFEEPIVYGGTTRQVQGGISLVPYRAATYKGNLSASLSRKRVTSTLNDVEIDVQHRDVTGYALSVGHRHYLGPAVLDFGAGLQGTLPGLSSHPGFVYGEPDWNGRSTILTANAGIYLPFQMASLNLAYQGNWQIQHAKTPIVPADYFTIGNRYTVRGFDGQMTLAAEDGWSLRNDLSLNLQPLGVPGMQSYAGLDIGRVGGPSARHLSGRTLAGAVVGLRGRLPLPRLAASYDFSLGWPLIKPESLKTAFTVFAASLMFEF